MKSVFLSCILALAIGCTSHRDPAPPAPPTPPAPTVTAFPPGTFQGRPKAMGLASGALAMVLAPAGNMDQTLIVEPGGGFRLELDGWQHARGALYTAPDGTLSVSTDATLTNAAGATVPLVLTGQRTGDRLTGTTNGGNFDLTLTTLQDIAPNIPARAGSYLSTASSNGQTVRLTIAASGNITGVAYASPTDAAARTNPLGNYSGTLSYADGDTAHLRNCFNIGFQWNTAAGGTSGLACFTDTGSMISLSANPTSSAVGSGQFSALFVKE